MESGEHSTGGTLRPAVLGPSAPAPNGEDALRAGPSDANVECAKAVRFHLLHGTADARYRPGVQIGQHYEEATMIVPEYSARCRLRFRLLGKDYGYEDQVPTWETMPCKSRMCIRPS